VLNKLDLVSESDAAQLEGLIKKLNTKATIVRSTFGNVDLKLLLNSGKFNMDDAVQMPGWYQELEGNHVPETLEYNISSFVYRAQRPFHPERLDKFMECGLESVLRSKGLLWVAGIQEYALFWSLAGKNVRIEDGTNWLHGSVDPSEWPPDTPQEYKSSPYGDRRQELVFIGAGLDETRLRAHLEEALVTDAEFQMGSEEWAKWSNPFLDEGGEKESKRRRIQSADEKGIQSSSQMQVS
jgi:G3E family GTPase